MGCHRILEQLNIEELSQFRQLAPVSDGSWAKKVSGPEVIYYV